MFLERLELVDFRCYRDARLVLDRGVSVLVGANAQGKTNLVEAAHYLAIGASHRVANDAPLVRAGATAAVVRGVARVDTTAGAGRALTVELELRPGGRNRSRVNGQPQPRARDAIGRVRSVLFAPEDLALVRGDPAERRRFLDELLGQRRPAYLAARAEYERVLRQRNALLRAGRAGDTGRGDAAADPTLATWTEALVVTGATLLAARIAAVHALAGPTAAAYRDLVADSPAREAAGRPGVAYALSTGRLVAATPGAGVPDPAALAAELRDGLAERSRAERERGVTLACTATTWSSPSTTSRRRATRATARPGRWRWPCAWPAARCSPRWARSRSCCSTTSSPSSTSAAARWRRAAPRSSRSSSPPRSTRTCPWRVSATACAAGTVTAEPAA